MSHPLRGVAAAALVSFALGCGVQTTDLALKIVDGRTGQPLAGAHVSVNNQAQDANPQGVAHFMLRPQTCDVAVDEDNYLPLTAMIVVGTGSSTSRTLPMYPRPDAPGPDPSPRPSGTPGPQPSTDSGIAVFGRVADLQGVRLTNAVVQLESTPGVPAGGAVTNAQGDYRLEHMPRGAGLRITAAADGYVAVTRTISPTTDWRVDFSGQYALKPTAAPQPGQPARIAVEGVVVDTFGAALDAVVVHVESNNVRFPFDQRAIAHQGKYHLIVPTELPLRFTASKGGYRATTFTQSVPASSFGLAVAVDFSGPRALDLLPAPAPGGAGKP